MIQSIFLFLRRGLQIRRNFSTTCTTLGTRGEKLQADAALCTRGERPKNGADAQPCLSDVYKNGTRARRRQADVPLCGRSMVEMLGVLAIIGVLSVGAIAGYSKAMFKYKLNKQTEQTNTIISALFRYRNDLWLAPHADTMQQVNLIPILKKLGEIPVEMYIENDENHIKDAFNTKCEAYHRTSGNLTSNGISYRCTTQRTEYGFEICRNLFTIAKEWHQEIHSIGAVAYQGETVAENGRYYGDSLCRGNSKCLKDITLNEIEQICNAEKNDDHYSIEIRVFQTF